VFVFLIDHVAVVYLMGVGTLFRKGVKIRGERKKYLLICNIVACSHSMFWHIDIQNG